jgi:hypothetical protein
MNAVGMAHIFDSLNSDIEVAVCDARMSPKVQLLVNKTFFSY